MKNIYPLIALLIVSFTGYSQSTNSIHNFDAITITGDTINLSQYAGKKLMIVNTASFCGYTPQFTELEQLYTQYNQNNFEILGFPCNDFGGQDPHSDSVIYQFCTNNYNVTFQMMKKVNIVTAPISPIYNWLQNASANGVQSASVTWNFHKFLIDEAGNWVAHYPSQTLPNDPAIVNWILSPNITTDINNVGNNLQDEISIVNNSNSLNVKFNKNFKSDVSIAIYDLQGRLVDVFNNEKAQKGGIFSYKTTALNDGIYLVKINGQEASETFKVAVMR